MLRRAELHRRPRAGLGDRHRRHPAGDGHPAARAAGDLRPLGLLAASGRRSAPRADHHRLLGQGRATGSPAARAGLGRHRRSCCRSPAWACSGSTPPACPPRTPTPRSSTPSTARRCSPSTAWPTVQHRCMVVANADQADAVAGRARPASTGSAGPAEPGRPGRRRVHRGAHRRATPRPPSGLRHVERVARRRPRGRRARTPWSAAASAIYLDTKTASQPRQPGDHPGRAARGAADPDAAAAGARRRR